MNNKDVLTGIFDHLNPEDFAKEHGPSRGSEAFTAWLADRISDARTAWTSTNGRPRPITVIADSGATVTLPVKPGETLEAYRNRIHVESRMLGATWLFTARKTMVGTYATTTDDPELPDATGDEEAIRKAAETHGAQLSEGIYYYAARHEGDEIERKHGMIPSENGVLGETIEGDADAQTVSFYGDLLA